jgi:tRNA A-37 threonylcarbamoyl transferase component Bud32
MPLLPLSHLSQAGRNPESAISFSLDEHNHISVEQWLRVLPNKRYVAKVQWRGQTLLAKLFVGARARQKLEQELAGAQLLEQAAIHAPHIVGSGHDANNNAWLLMDYLDGSQDLYQQAKLDPLFLSANNRQVELALPLVDQVAELHNAGLRQADLHPANFLFRHGGCFVIDCADIEQLQQDEEREENLALMLAQLPSNWWPSLISRYRSHGFSVDEAALHQAADEKLLGRAQDLARKSLRDCTLFKVERSAREFRALWREQSDSWRGLLDTIDPHVEQGLALKQGGSATVSRVNWRGQDIVIKRYNLKSPLHRLRRCLRPSRAWHCWQVAHQLRAVGIHTPKPLAMLERRCGPLRGTAYLVTELGKGKGLVEALADKPSALAAITTALTQLMAAFKRFQISHGDCKASNLLWCEQSQQLSVIDLDALCWHRSEKSWQRQHEKDIARLLRNWPSDSDIHRQLHQALNQ